MVSKRKKKIRWNDYPPLYDPDKYEPIDWDLDSDQAEQEAQVGQTYAKFVRNAKAIVTREVTRRERTGKVVYETIPGSKMIRKKPIYKETVSIEETVKTIPFAIEIWTVLAPPETLPLLPNGLWFSDRWKPKVYKSKMKDQIISPKTGEGAWVLASPHDFQNWSQIPTESKRVDFCEFVIQDEREDDELLAQHSKVLDELVKAWKKRKKK